jgi:DNA mismatch repair protein MutL
MPMPDAPKMNIDPHFNPFESEGTKGYKRERIDANWQNLYEPTKNHQAFQQRINNEDTPPLAALSAAPLNFSFIQLKGKYLLTPVKSGVMLIDIRRARQRIYYEQYIRRLANHQHESQQQIFPETVTLRPEDYLLLETVFDDLHLLGYDVAPLGNYTVAVNGLPADLGAVDVQEWLQILIDELHQASASLKERREATLAASLAKTAAGYSTETLEPEEAQSLIDRLFDCETPAVCPAGKPVIHLIAIEELDKKMLKN